VEREQLESIRGLLQATRVLSLAYAGDDGPEAALLPFAPRDDCRALYVQASTLARHTRALQNDARLGVLVHAQDSGKTDPMQLPRLSVGAIVSRVEQSSAEYDAAAAQFVARFPAAKMTLGFGDFGLYMLTLGAGRFVEGFARAFDVTANTFADIAGL
jgi:heme oxygenase (biliverdin-IX-beta and delta-forming)